jgi:photosystem II stability/assembly factor-like uncharacterized protein
MKTWNYSLFAGLLCTAALLGFAVSAHAEDDDEEEEHSAPINLNPANNAREGSFLSTYYQASALRKAAATQAVPWEPLGPYGIGRINDVAVDPSNDQTLYVGAAGGGVWKSTNGGTNLTQIFNDYDQSIGSIAVDPSNSQIVWVGGGENMYGGGSLTYPGTGIFKSTDGGATWIKQKMSPTSGPSCMDSLFYTSRITVTPGNSNRVFVAAQGPLWGKNTCGGVYRTTDGGANWAQVLGPRSGNPNFSAGDDSTGATDVRVHPTTPNRVFANFFTAQRLPYGRTWGGPSSRVWRSDDGGATWTILGAAEGLPTTDLGKSTMDFCAVSNPNIAYMVYFTAANQLKNVYKSSDGGMTWTTISTLNGNNSALYSYYAHTFGQIRVNPSDPNDVIVMGISSYRTTNGGTSWSSTFPGAHDDKRTMAWSRTNGNLVYLGDDGGIKKYTTGPNGTVSTLGTANMNISQLYGIDVAQDDANANYRYIGLQDNGTLYTTNGGTSWSNYAGGDGMQFHVDHGNSNYVIGGSQYGAFQLSTNRGASRSSVSGYNGRKLWDAGIALDSASHYTYLGSQYVHRAAPGSASYTQISNDLTNGDHSLANYPMGTISAISAHNNTLFAGTDDGNVWVNLAANTATTSSGWVKIRDGNGTDTCIDHAGERGYDGWIKLITPDYNDPTGHTAYIGISYFRWGIKCWRPGLYKVVMNGSTATWTDISGDLPRRINANRIISDGRGYLYAGTDYGVYFSVNGGVNWQWLGDRTLPIVPVNDLVIHAKTNYLYIATYGRGTWRYPLTSAVPVRHTQNDLTVKGNQMLKHFPDPVVETTNIQFNVSDPQPVSLAVYDITGREVRILLDKSVEADKNYDVTWNRTNDHGDRLQKGIYILRLVGEKVTLARKMTLQ